LKAVSKLSGVVEERFLAPLSFGLLQFMSTFSHPALLAPASAKSVFHDLFDGRFSPLETERAASFLGARLSETQFVESDLPLEMDELEAWMHDGVERVGALYHDYLEQRRQGAPRHYFDSKAHALYFLRGVAPTKLVDGAWLYGILARWNDPRFLALVKTYLEELGEGDPAKNHVVLYRKLLVSHGLERFDDLSEEHFTQAAIQLALAYNAERFLPEIIGFNLGYEQLPLHLLISAYELKELGVDPYYFTLHITVDNADSGHARQAVDAVFAAMPRVGDAGEFWARVRAGYALNFLGAGTTSIIEGFGCEREMVSIFERKGAIGRFAHSDYRTVDGRTVNEWLSDPADTAELVRAMEGDGWFKRGEDPANSRFWKLIQGERARMFGVFSPYEQQIIWDWIAADAPDKSSFARPTAPKISSEDKQKLRASMSPIEEGATDFDAETRDLERTLALSHSQTDTMETLISLMSPALHHSAAGLKATRIFNDVLA